MSRAHFVRTVSLFFAGASCLIFPSSFVRAETGEAHEFVGMDTQATPDTAALSSEAPVGTGCPTDGLAQTGGNALPAFYTPENEPVLRDAQGLRVPFKAGALSLGGKIYKLSSIEIPQDGAFPLSGVQHDRHLRLVHTGADGAQAVVIVPLVSGAANMVVESLLIDGDAPRIINPNALLPADRSYTRMDGHCADGGAELRLVLHPVEISAEQVKRLDAAL